MTTYSRIRQNQIDTLNNWWQSALDNNPCFILITGEQGEGKKWLVDAFKSTLEADQMKPYFEYSQAYCSESGFVAICAELCNSLIWGRPTEFIDAIATSINLFGHSSIGSVFDYQRLANSQHNSLRNLVSLPSVDFNPQGQKQRIRDLLLPLEIHDLEFICAELDVKPDDLDYVRPVTRFATSLIRYCDKLDRLTNLEQCVHNFCKRDLESSTHQDTDKLNNEVARILSDVSHKHPILITVFGLERLTETGVGQLESFMPMLHALEGRVMIIGVLTKGRFENNQEYLSKYSRFHFASETLNLSKLRNTSPRQGQEELFDEIIESSSAFLPDAVKKTLFEVTKGKPGELKHALIRLGVKRGSEHQKAITISQINEVLKNELNYHSVIQAFSLTERTILNVCSLCEISSLSTVIAQASVSLKRFPNIEAAMDCINNLEKHHQVIEEVGTYNVLGQGCAKYCFDDPYFQKWISAELSGSERRALHRQIAETYEFVFQNEAFREAKVIAFHYEKSEDARAVKWLRHAGDSYSNSGDYKEAIECYETAIILTDRFQSQDKPKDKADLYSRLSIALSRDLNTIQESIKKAKEAIGLADLLQSQDLRARSRLSFFIVVFDGTNSGHKFSESDEKDAIDAILEARDIYSSLGMTAYQAKCDANIGNWFGSVKRDYKNCRHRLTKALEFFRSEKDYWNQTTTLNNLGNCLVEANLDTTNSSELRDAIRYYEDAIRSADLINDREGTILSYYGLGDVYRVKGFTDFSSYKSYEHYVNGLNIAININVVVLASQIILEMIRILIQSNCYSDAMKLLAFVTTVLEEQKNVEHIMKTIAEIRNDLELQPSVSMRADLIDKHVRQLLSMDRLLKDNRIWLTRQLDEIINTDFLNNELRSHMS